MSKYLEELKKIDHQVYYDMGKASQITIDFLEDMIDQLEDRDLEDEPIERDEIGSLQYTITCIIEIINPLLKYDIEVFKNIDNILDQWVKDIEFVNTVLGIPKHKG
jgi:hypothetical protein